MHPALIQLQAFLDHHGYLLVFAVGLAEFGGVPIASTPILLGLGAFVASGTLHPVTTIALAALGGLVGDSAWYALARWRGHRLIHLACGLASNPNACVLGVEDRIRRTGPRFLVPAKFLPGTSNLTAAASGLSGLSAPRFLLYDGAGLLLWSGVHVTLGALFANQIEVVLDWTVRLLDWVVGIGVALVLGALVWRLLKVRIHRRLHQASDTSVATHTLRNRVYGAALLVGMAGAGVFLALSLGRAEPTPASSRSCEAFDHDHPAWARVLRAHVPEGEVDYAAMAQSDAPQLGRYLRSLQNACGPEPEDWTRSQKLALWLNAYNAYTVRLVLDHHPVDSIREIGVVPGAAFRKRFIELPWHSASKISLDDIEHRILRARFREPRIHFALVCASRGCPDLRREPYLAPSLDSQLDDAARRFLRDRTKNRFDAGEGVLRLSPIFDWFREDFERAAGSVPRFVVRYVEPETARAIRSGDVRIEHLDYDWSLNGR